MSEYINNVTRRKQILKNVLRQLHEGKSVEEVKAEFGGLAREAGSAEIAEVEQMLIDDGLPPEEIQSLCDVHVAVFKEGLDQQASPETTPGHPVHTLRAENQVALHLLDELRKTIQQLAGDPNLIRLQTFEFQLGKLAEIDRHYLRKENLVFPYLEKYGFQGPSKVMWGIHDEIRARLKKLAALVQQHDLAALPQIESLFGETETSIREMVYKEEKILLPAAMERFSETDWAAIHSQENDFGYFLLAPKDEWWPKVTTKPELPTQIKPVTEVSASQPGDCLPLSTGALTLEQINLMLVNLPVDITFVDENDEVRYFSQTHERIFDRTAAIIGRKVQNCHPPQSVDKVQRILDDFRNGQRNVAEFWINMGGRFINIRYFALRDSSGKYRGTLEVSQDGSHLRALEGERRLLDD